MPERSKPHACEETHRMEFLSLSFGIGSPSPRFKVQRSIETRRAYLAPGFLGSGALRPREEEWMGSLPWIEDAVPWADPNPRQREFHPCK